VTGLSGLLAKELIVDTHEHISPPQVASGYDLYDLIMNSYVAADVVSAAAGSALLEAEVGIGEKWRAYREFLPAVENTSYFRALFEGLGELYGVEVPPRNEDSFARLSERISEASRRPGWTREVFRRAKIEVALLDQFWNVGNTEIDRELFSLVLRVDPFLCLHKADHDGNDASEMAAARGISVESFGEYMKFVDFVCEENVKAGAVCFKIASAYERTLGFDEVSEGEARRIFEKREGAATEAEGVAFGDFVVHHIVGRTIEFGLPVQIHTGLQHGDGNVLSNSNPLLLARQREGRGGLFRRCSRSALMRGSFAGRRRRA